MVKCYMWRKYRKFGNRYCGNGNEMEMKFCGGSANSFWYHWKLCKLWEVLGRDTQYAKVTDWWLRRQRQKFFLLFLRDHLRGQNRVCYFSVSDFQDGCTWLHLLLARLFLPDHSNLLVQVLPSWTSVTQHFLVLTKWESAICSSFTEMKVEFE